jgi:hypothetical protein
LPARQPQRAHAVSDAGGDAARRGSGRRGRPHPHTRRRDRGRDAPDDSVGPVRGEAGIADQRLTAGKWCVRVVSRFPALDGRDRSPQRSE